MARSGGVNIAPAEVDAVLLTHPSVGDAGTIGVPDDEWGEVLVTVAVTDADLDELRDHVAATYPRSFAPRRLVRVDALPLLPNGKTDRLAVQALARG